MLQSMVHAVIRSASTLTVREREGTSQADRPPGAISRLTNPLPQDLDTAEVFIGSAKLFRRPSEKNRLLPDPYLYKRLNNC